MAVVIDHFRVFMKTFTYWLAVNSHVNQLASASNIMMTHDILVKLYMYKGNLNDI